MSELATTSVIAAALAALWILIAAALSVVAARRLCDASSVVSAARSLQSLIELSPARPLVVRSDGGIEADSRLLREIGIAKAPKSLSDLVGSDHGFVAEDVEALSERVRQAAISGERVQCQMRVSGAGRVLDVRGAPAPAPEPAGTILL